MTEPLSSNLASFNRTYALGLATRLERNDWPCAALQIRLAADEIERLRAALTEIAYDVGSVERARHVSKQALRGADETSEPRICVNALKGHAGDPCPVCGDGPCQVLKDEPASPAALRAGWRTCKHCGELI